MPDDKNPESRVLFLGQEECAETEVAHRVASCFRLFRHDLQNDLQLVYGYLQLGKTEEQVRAKLDQATERTRLAGHIFNAGNLRVSCLLYHIWADAEKSGLKFKIAKCGDLQNFGTNWSNWDDQVAMLWTYCRDLALSRTQSQLSIAISAGGSVWRFVAGDGEVSVTCTSGNED